MRNTEVVWNTVDGEAVALSPDTGFYYGFNSTASIVWKFIATPKTFEEIVAHIASEFAVESKVIHNDIVELLRTLEQYSLIWSI